MNKPTIDFETEQAVLNRQTRLCAKCGCSLVDHPYHLDFVLPWYCSTPNNSYIVSPANLVVLCEECFKSRGGYLEKVKIGFKLEPDVNTWTLASSNIGFEWLWAEPVGSFQFRIKNSPFYVHNISFNDIVEASLNDKSELIFTKVIERSGNSVVLLYLAGDEVNIGEFNRLSKKLYELGCQYERSGARLISFLIPPETTDKKVEEILNEGGELGVWQIQDMCVQH